MSIRKEQNSRSSFQNPLMYYTLKMLAHEMEAPSILQQKALNNITTMKTLKEIFILNDAKVV